MSNCASHAFWLGMTESGGLLTDIDGNNVLHAPWDLHSNPDAPEPNNSAGDEKCIRMKGKSYYHSRFDFFILFFFLLNEPKKRDSIVLFRNPEHFRNSFFQEMFTMTQNAAANLQEEFEIKLEWDIFASTMPAKVKKRIK